jgi:carboxylesterase type B
VPRSAESLLLCRARHKEYSKLFEGAPVPPVRSVVDAMQGYWTRFAHAGDPNGSSALAWPKFTPDGERHIVFDRELRTGEHHLESECDFWASTNAGSR